MKPEKVTHVPENFFIFLRCAPSCLFGAAEDAHELIAGDGLVFIKIGGQLIQLAAVRSALSSTAKIILKDHIEHCVSGADSGDSESLTALNEAIDRFI